MKKLLSLVLGAVMLLSGLSFAAPVHADSSNDGTGYDNTYVRTIDFSQFSQEVQQDELMQGVGKALLNANKYALTTWYDERKNFDEQELIAGKYLDLKAAADYDTTISGGVPEYVLRAPASQAFGLAISLKTGLYNEEYTTVPEEEALDRAIKLATSVAYTHKANSAVNVSGYSWGGDWQAANWAYDAGYAAWLLWDALDEEQRTLVINMVISEADRFNNTNALYYCLPDGTPVYAGDSRADDMAWNTELLNLAYHMLPKHENAAKWRYRHIEYQLAAFSTPEMNSSSDELHGKAASEWVNGYNVTDDGLVINHGIIHPSYMATATGINYSIVNTLAGEPISKADFYNLDNLYKGLCETTFDGTEYAEPGGSCYQEDGTIYYPQESDWGQGVYDCYLNFDISAYVYGYHKDGKKWAEKHLEKLLEQQARPDHEDGHTYEKGEFTYPLNEEAISTRVGCAWMTLWLDAQTDFEVSNEAITYPHDELPALGENQEYVFVQENAFVRAGSNGDTCYYPSDILEVKNDGGETSSYTREAYVKFDVNSLKGYPTSAELYIPAVDAGGAIAAKGVTNTLAYVTSDNWSERTLTYNTRPEGMREDVMTWTPSAEGLTIDITGYVREACQTDGGLTFCLYSQTSVGGETWMKYGTNLQADPNYIPRILLTYGEKTESYLKGTDTLDAGTWTEMQYVVADMPDVSELEVELSYTEPLMIRNITGADYTVTGINKFEQGKITVSLEKKTRGLSSDVLFSFEAKADDLAEAGSLSVKLLDANEQVISECAKDIQITEGSYRGDIALIEPESIASDAIADTAVAGRGDAYSLKTYGNGKGTRLGAKEYGGDNMAHQAFFEFALPDEIYDKMELRFYVLDTSDDSTNKNQIYRFQYIPETDWPEAELLWGNRPDSMQNVGGDGSIPEADEDTLLETPVTEAGSYVTVDITNKAKELMADNKTKMTVAFYATKELNCSVHLSSRETEDRQLRPQLICYNEGGEEAVLTLESQDSVSCYATTEVLFGAQNIASVQDAVVIFDYSDNLVFTGAESLAEGVTAEVLEDMNGRVRLRLQVTGEEPDYTQAQQLVKLSFKSMQSGAANIAVSATAAGETLEANQSFEVTAQPLAEQKITAEEVGEVLQGSIFDVNTSLSELEAGVPYEVSLEYDPEAYEFVEGNSADMVFSAAEEAGKYIGTPEGDQAQLSFGFRMLKGGSPIKVTVKNADGVSCEAVVTPQMTVPPADTTELKKLYEENLSRQEGH